MPLDALVGLARWLWLKMLPLKVGLVLADNISSESGDAAAHSQTGSVWSVLWIVDVTCRGVTVILETPAASQLTECGIQVCAVEPPKK